MKYDLWRCLVAASGLILLGAACAPKAAPTPTPAQPPSPAPAAETPTLVPIALAGPGGGASMAWLDGSTLVYVPAGEFVRGMGVGDAPQKAVSLDGYWIYQTEVTNRMYAQCAASGNCAPPAQELGAPVYDNPEYGDHPLVGVTWDMAANYCAWVQGGLPSEAQWEKAARGPDGAVYPWGNDDPGCDLANYGGCLGHTSGVTDYPAGRSPYGALDMAGNVYEWVNDYYGESYYDNAPSLNPGGPESGGSRVIRGSSFESEPKQLLSAVRHFGGPAYHSRDLGFRCAVNQPKTIAPYCQTAAFLPKGSAGIGECQLPPVEVRGQYCAAGKGYATVDLPPGAVYQLDSPDYTCSEGIFNGLTRLTCKGPDDSTGQVTVCNPACSGSPQVTGVSPACTPGYNLDPSGACVYAPIPGQPGAAGCPPGYILIERDGQKTCALGRSQDGQCPIGLYFDSLYGACAPPSDGAVFPYGIDNPDLAAQFYQGCAPGYTYDPTFQCCQAVVGGTYPGCAPGYTFDAEAGACSPGKLRLSGPGCVTVSLYAMKCGQPVDICSKITVETTCVRNSYACEWDDRLNVCKLKK